MNYNLLMQGSLKISELSKRESLWLSNSISREYPEK